MGLAMQPADCPGRKPGCVRVDIAQGARKRIAYGTEKPTGTEFINCQACRCARRIRRSSTLRSGTFRIAQPRVLIRLLKRAFLTRKKHSRSVQPTLTRTCSYGFLDKHRGCSK